MQETSVALWQKWEDFDPNRDFCRWACGMAHIEILRHRRKYASKRLFFDESLIRDIAEQSLERNDVAEQRTDALKNCLKKLGSSDLALVEHRYRKDVTAKQTAEDLGRSPSTVYKALARIRRTLLACVRRSARQEFSS